MSIYCTYVTFYSGNKLPPFYIGSSSIKRVESGYHGSIKSKRWKEIYKQELKENPHLFSTEIIETFETRISAFEHELELHIANDVVKSDLFFNESFARKSGFFGMKKKGSKNPNLSKIRKTQVMVKNKLTNEIIGFVERTHPKFISGEYVGIRYGTKQTILTKQKIAEGLSDSNKRKDYIQNKKGITNYRNIITNQIKQLHKEDPLLLTGEWVGQSKK